MAGNQQDPGGRKGGDSPGSEPRGPRKAEARLCRKKAWLCQVNGGRDPKRSPKPWQMNKHPTLRAKTPLLLARKGCRLPRSPGWPRKTEARLCRKKAWPCQVNRGQRPEKEPQAVADEQTPNTASEGTSPAGGEVPPVTEKPVATRRKISQYVVSVDEATGSIVKIEKMNEQTGKPRELTQEEYAAAYGFASYAAPYYAAYAASLYDPLSSPAVQAYVKGVSDYLKAFTPER